MDRTSWIVVILSVVSLVVWQYLMAEWYPESQKAAEPASSVSVVGKAPAGRDGAETGNENVPEMKPHRDALVVDPELPEEKRVLMENDVARVELSTHGGAVRRVTLKHYMAQKGVHVVMNRGVDEPMGNLAGWFGEKGLVAYNLESRGEREVLFSREISPGVVLKRRYMLGDGFTVTLSQTVENKSGEPVTLPSYRLFVGAGAPVYITPDSEVRRYYSGGWFTTGGSYKSTQLTSFDESNWILWRHPGKSHVESDPQSPVRWASATNQFFVSVISTEGTPARLVDLRKIHLTNLATDKGWVPDGVQTHMWMPELAVATGDNVEQVFSLYAGPKELARLEELPYGQDVLMGFGWMGFISRPLLWMLNYIYSFVGNYGLAIIILTLLIKAVLWYPQTKANRSMKKMQLISPMLKEVQERYKEDPQRMQQEMMKLYKDYDVNPVGGCLPMLVQLPIFIGLYYMLMSAIELRHQHFLWISDLSQPDTVAHLPIPGFEIPINVMPLLMAATMFVTMNITPQPEGVDNPAMKMMKFMPLLLLVICYKFASALSLYWTVQNVLSAVQMLYNLRQPMPTLDELKQSAKVTSGKKSQKRSKKKR